MKKMYVLLLTTTMVLSLSACGSSDSGETQTSGTNSASTVSEENQDSSSESSGTEKSESSESTSSDSTAENSSADTGADPEILGVSNEYYSIEVNNVTWDDKNVTFDVTYTNNDDIAATFDFDAVDINGCLWYGGAYKTVEAGATVTATAQMRQDSNSIFDIVDAYNFVQPDEIIIYPDVVNDDGDYDKSLTTPFTFYPTGMNPEEIVYSSYTAKDTDIAIIDESDMKVYITSINPKSFKDCYYLYIQNDTDSMLKCSMASDTYQENGVTCTTTFGWIDVHPGERISRIIYMHEDDVQNLSGTVVLTDFDDVWGDDPLYSGDFSINVADYDDGE